MGLAQFFKSKNKKDEAGDLFISLLLSDQVLQAALWTVENGQIVILEKSSIKEYSNDKDCLLKTDSCLQELGPDSENVNQTVFAFDPSWVSDQGIKLDKNNFLKKLTKELSLKPVGFVVVTEALIEELSSKDPLLSVLIIYFEAKKLFLNLVKQGQLLKSIEIGRSDDIKADLIEGLARLQKTLKKSEHSLPAHIQLLSLVLDPRELADLQQEILSVDWEKEAKFLQKPLINLFPREKLLDVMTKQGGRAVAEAQGLIAVDPVKKAQAEAKKLNQEEKAVSAASSFGVPISAEHLKDSDSIAEPDLNLSEAVGSSAPPDGFLSANGKKFSKAAAFKKFGKFFHTGKKERQSKHDSHLKMIILGIVTGFLALLIFFYLFLILSYKVLIEIKLKPIVVSKELNITLDPEAEASDPENLILKASLEEKELTIKDTVETTGVKPIGEKASGKITILNKTDSEITLEKGSELSSGDLKFALNDGVKVEAATVKEKDSGDGEIKEYGKTVAKVTAVEIGADGNLSKDSEFKFLDSAADKLTATAIEDFSGGSSREIRVVSEQDRKDLLASLTDKLQTDAEKEFKEESGSGRYLLPTGEVKVLSADFDAEVGDEVDALSLELTAKFYAVAYLSTDLRPLAESVLSNEIPDGYRLAEENPEILSAPASDEEADEDSKQIVLAANISAQAIPILDTDLIKDEVKGQEIEAVDPLLEEKKEIAESELVLQPAIAKYFVKKVPQQEDRIEIKLLNYASNSKEN
ncbi:MAG: hypothetical protein PVJ09_03095 [Candidatus Woesebacteria bacterium]|jgi:hypothetical protein